MQRFQCLKCGVSFADKQPLDNLRVDFKQACVVLNMLSEGMGIRAISRLTGLHQQTVLNVLARAGSKAGRFLDATLRNLTPVAVEADEMFCFVQCKERNNKHHDFFKGDQYLFMAMDADTKLIISHVIGKRTVQHTEELLKNLRERTTGTFQITTDAFEPYKINVPRYLKGVDFAQVIKKFASTGDDKRQERRYSPSHCVGIRTIVRRGNPDRSRISTSYIERLNLSVRTFNRRFVRLTLGFSKKYEYLLHSCNLFVFHYNFIRQHSTLNNQTPAMASKIADHQMTFEELLLTPD